MATYTVYFSKNETLNLTDKYHPEIDKIPYVEYDDYDGGMEIGDVSQDETLALKIAGRYWETEKVKIYSDKYKASAEDMMSYVMNEGILKSTFSDKNPYKKIVVKKTG